MIYPDQQAAPSDNPAVLGIRSARLADTFGKEENSRYRFKAVDYITEKLGWTPWRGTMDKPGQAEVIEAYNLALLQLHERRDFELGKVAEADLLYWTPGDIIQNVIRVEAGHTVGKTKLAAGIFSHFFDNFRPIIYTFAPTSYQIKQLLWKEIKDDRQGKNLPGRILETCEIKTPSPTWFAAGRATDNSGNKGSHRVHGQHGEHLMFIVDEAEAVDDYVFNAIESMTSGGIAIVLMFANPETRSSRFHKQKDRSNTRSFRISCLHHPNVVAGKELVPGAVRRDYVLSMIEDHCEPVETDDPDNHTFTVPYPVLYKGRALPALTHWKPDAEFLFRVRGIAPANLADNTFCPVGRYEASKDRDPAIDDPNWARIGIDAARFGKDYGTIYVRWSGRVWRWGQLAQQDSGEYTRQAKTAALWLSEQGVTSLHFRIDGGGGFGSGVIDNLNADAQLQDLFADLRIIEVHFGGNPHDEKSYRNRATEMYAHAAESIKRLAIVRPPDALEADLCERTYGYVNWQGISVKQIEAKDDFKKRKKRSCDDGDGFVLAAAPDFIFDTNDAPAGMRPTSLVRSIRRRR